VQHVVEDLVRLVGWVMLKAFTGGRYKSDRGTGLLLEGSVGLMVIALVFWIVYSSR
jgi:hypothetical protein